MAHRNARTTVFRWLFDDVVPLRGQGFRDCRPKLDLNLYTSFARNLYLDADSLAVRDVTFLFDRHRGQSFVVLGRQINHGHWYGDVRDMCRIAAARAFLDSTAGSCTSRTPT